MEDQEIDDLLQEALKLHEEGKSYAEIRAHFKDEHSEDLISYIIRLVDELAIEENRIKEEINKNRFKMYIGIIAFGLSSILIYKFYTNDALTGYISLLAWLPMIFSAYLLWSAYNEMHILKKTEPEIDDVKFRMKRRKRYKIR